MSVCIFSTVSHLLSPLSRLHVDVNCHKTSSFPQSEALVSVSHLLSVSLQQNASWGPSRWFQRRAFYSVEATVKIHKTWQWRMTRCQLTALTKDRELSPLSFSERTHTKTISTTATSEPKEGEKIKSVVTQVLSKPCSGATLNCLEDHKVSLCTARNVFCQAQTEKQMQVNVAHMHIEDGSGLASGKKTIRDLATEFIFSDQYVWFNACNGCSCSICVTSCYGSISSIKPDRQAGHNSPAMKTSDSAIKWLPKVYVSLHKLLILKRLIM